MSAKWELFDDNDDEPILLEKFSTKTKAMVEAHFRGLLVDRDPNVFHYDEHHHVWNAAGYTVTDHGHPMEFEN